MAITILLIIALIASAIFHEYAHGWAAFKLGDNTAKDAGRLTLNPLAHLDPFGSVLMPFLLVLMHSPFFIAYAKPVPYNPYNLRDQRWGDLKVAIAGPATNLLLALASGLVTHLLPIVSSTKIALLTGFFSSDNASLLAAMQGSFVSVIYVMCIVFCYINLLLMIFNLIPIPPLDGSKVLLSFLPYNWQMKFYKIEPYGLLIVLFLLMFGAFDFILGPLLGLIFSLIVSF